MASENTNVVADGTNIDQLTRASASTYAPLPPAVGGVLDNAGDIQNALASGSITDDRQPEFRGQGTPGDTILVKDNGTDIGWAEVDDNGHWSFTPSTDLIEGHHAITLVARDAQGNDSLPSAPFNFEIDVTPPDASKLAITSVVDAVGGVTGHVSSGDATDDARPLLSGISSGVPGHTVVVMVRDSTGTHALGEAVIGESGNWTFQVDAPLAAGQNTFMLVETDTAGNETAPTDRYRVSVNTDKPTPPVIQSVFDDVGQPHLLQPGESTNDTKPTLSGTAQANHTVKFYDGSTYLGETVADANGQWTFTPKTELTDGAHGITATSTSPLGQTSSASDAWNFVIDTTPPTQTAELIDVGKDSGFDADDFLTNDGSAGRLLHGNLSAPLTAGDTLQVSTDGGQTWKAAFVAGAKWSAQDDNSHTGDWVVQTRVVDAAGNLGPVESQAMALDTTAPGAPTKVVVTDSGVEVQFNSANVAVGHKISLVVRGNHFDYTLTAADVAAGKALIPGFKAVDAGQVAAAISDDAGNLSLYLSPPFQGQDGLSSIPKTSAGATYTTAAGVNVEAIQGYVEPGDAGRLWFVGKGIVNFGIPSPANSVSLLYGNTHGAPYGKVEFYSAEGVLLGTQNMLYNPGLPTPMSKIEFASNIPISDVKVYCLDSGSPVGVNEAMLLKDLTWSGGGESWSAAQHQALTDASVGTLHGGSDDNVFTVTDVKHLADSALSGNGGLDTLKLTGANQILDLTGLGHKVSSIETVDITGTGNNTLNLSLGDVMENGAVDQFMANGRVQMMVKGNAGDAVSLLDLLPNGTDPGDWVKGANVTIDGVVYEVYAHSGFKADLLVQQGVTVTLQISIDSVMDDVGAVTGAIAKGGFTDDATPTLNGRAAPGGTVKVYDGSTLLGSTVADAKGNWNLTPGTSLSEGLHSLSASVTPMGGSESARTPIFDLTVDTAPPAAPTIVSVYDDVGTTGNLISGATTDDDKPDFKGKAEANSTVVIYDKGVEIARVQANSSGDWMYTPGTALSAGVHKFIVTAVDQAENISASSESFDLFVSLGGFENFNGLKQNSASGVTLTSGVTITGIFSTTDESDLYPSDPNVSVANQKNSLWILDNASVTLKLPSPAKEVSFLQTAQTDGHLVSYFNIKGVLLGQVPIKGHAGKVFQKTSFEAKAGEEISSIRINSVDDPHAGFLIEGLSWGAGAPVLFEFPAPDLNHETSADIAEVLRDAPFDHPTQAYTDSDDTLIAKLGFADRLEGGAGNDTFTTIGTADVVHGGSGNDTIRINSGDFERIDGGLDIDTLVMDGKAMRIDLSAFGLKVQGFEKFDLGAGGNTLALSAADVLAGGVRDMVTADGKVQMLVNGANGDVDLLGGSDGWTQGSNTTVGDVTYSVYTNLAGTAELLVEDKVHVTIM